MTWSEALHICQEVMMTVERGQCSCLQVVRPSGRLAAAAGMHLGPAATGGAALALQAVETAAGRAL